jgi:hypothetical protein
VGLRLSEIKAGDERDAMKKGGNIEGKKNKQGDKEKRKQKKLMKKNEGKE